jgi:hypothetical protein
MHLKWPGDPGQYLGELRKDPATMRLIRIGQRRARRFAAKPLVRGGLRSILPASKSLSLLLSRPLGRATIVCRNAYTATKLAILWIPLF